MSESRIQPSVNAEVPPSLVFGEKASNVKTFPASRPATGENGYANFHDGIPADYSSGSANALKARIDDVNAIGRLASGFHYYRQCGGIITYSKEVASMIGGYPKGAVLEYWDGMHYRRVISLLENNLYDFVQNPNYIDGIHWGYADTWAKPYGIFVDPSRCVTLDVLSGGTPNSALGWVADESEYNWIDEDADSWYRGRLALMKSRWTLISNNCFVVMSAKVDTSNLTQTEYPSLYWMVAGYRVKDSKGVLKTHQMTVSASRFATETANAEVAGSVYPLLGNGYFDTVQSTMRLDIGFGTGSTCMYMSRGSMLQFVYSPQVAQRTEIKVKFVRLKGR